MPAGALDAADAAEAKTSSRGDKRGFRPADGPSSTSVPGTRVRQPPPPGRRHGDENGNEPSSVRHDTHQYVAGLLKPCKYHLDFSKDTPHLEGQTGRVLLRRSRTAPLQPWSTFALPFPVSLPCARAPGAAARGVRAGWGLEVGVARHVEKESHEQVRQRNARLGGAGLKPKHSVCYHP